MPLVPPTRGTALAKKKATFPHTLPYLVNGSLKKGRSNRKGVGLDLTLRFGEDRLTFTYAGITLIDVGIGIRSAFLNWTLYNCHLPEGEWMLDPKIESTLTVQRTSTDTLSQKNDDARGLYATIACNSEPSLALVELLKLGAKRQHTRSAERTEGHEVKDTFEQVICTITARGNSHLPSWQIEAPPGRQTLRGTLLADQRFALAVGTGPHASISISLEVPRHGYLLRAECGELARAPNKWGLTRLLLQKRLLSKPIHITQISLEGED
jgi:hypothetical protein